jgi:predicted RNA binding protein YcfA (HicA-like mRNA interferase family)
MVGLGTVETNRGRIVRRLLKEGWELSRHGGEHDIYRHDDRPVVIQVPRHRTISTGVARSIAKLAGWR